MEDGIPEKVSINKAIASIDESYLSKGEYVLLEKNFGPATAQRVKEIYTMAMDRPVNWKDSSMTMNKALAQLSDYLENEFPYLDALAR